jgi:hypothetical protein
VRDWLRELRLARPAQATLSSRDACCSSAVAVGAMERCVQRPPRCESQIASVARFARLRRRLRYWRRDSHTVRPLVRLGGGVGGSARVGRSGRRPRRRRDDPQGRSRRSGNAASIGRCTSSAFTLALARLRVARRAAPASRPCGPPPRGPSRRARARPQAALGREGSSVVPRRGRSAQRCSAGV